MSYEQRVSDSLTALESKKIQELNKLADRLDEKLPKIIEQHRALEVKISTLRHEVEAIKTKAYDRYQAKCKHTDIIGPYECARDDCSGNHYRCRDCGKSEFSRENILKK